MTCRRSGSLSLLAAVDLFLQFLNPGLRGGCPILGGVSPFQGGNYMDSVWSSAGLYVSPWC